MSEHTHVFLVRGRPVGFVPGSFGGALVAVERGYFPVSSTGYRSLAGHFGISGEADPSALSPEFLDALADAQDLARRGLLARLRRARIPTADRLGNFIAVTMDAEAALAEGFFAPDEDRFALWRGAFRLLHLIDTDPRFQPAPTAPAWPPSRCAEALAVRRTLLDCVRQLAAGELPALPGGMHGAARAYLALPAKAAGEPSFALLVITPELPLDLPPAAEFNDEREEEPEPIEIGEDNPARLSLL